MVKEIKKTQMEKLLKLTRQMFISQVIDECIEKGICKVPKFGKFRILKRKGQEIKNPIGTFKIPDTIVFKFTPSKTLKKRIKERLKTKQG